MALATKTKYNLLNQAGSKELLKTTIPTAIMCNYNSAIKIIHDHQFNNILKHINIP
jgi:hypothetical protein